MDALLTHIGTYPDTALLIVFLTAFLESVALVGAVVPAAIVMFAAGTLIGTGALDVWVTLGIAALGAVGGDGLSFELGRIYADRIRRWPIVQRNSGVLDRGERFVQHHGGKSILFARFLAPVRAVVPLVAGIGRMPAWKFYAINIASALVWAPAHILPGILFGASIRVAEAVSARLALLLLLVAALTWTVIWVVRISMQSGFPHIKSWREHILRWTNTRHSRFSRIVSALLDPQKPESQLLLILAIVSLLCGWLFFGVLQDVLAHDTLVQADVAIFHFFQTLRTSATDRIMIGITEMGSGKVLLPVVLVVSVWLLLRRCRHTLGYWVAVTAFTEVLVQLFKFTVGRQRPTDLYRDKAFEQFSFPSGHATSSMIIYGFLAFLLSRKQPPILRLAIGVVTAILIALIGLSRLYLGAHWFSDVIGGFSLGLIWIALMAMAYTHYRVNDDIQPRRLAVLVVTTLLLFGAWSIRTYLPTELNRYTVQALPPVFSIDRWIEADWKQVPRQRMEIGGELEERLPLQWADSAPVIAQRLANGGWRAAPEWSMRSAMLWLTPNVSAADLPVLPKFNQGDGSDLAFIHVDPERPLTRIVFRLWQSRYTVLSPATQVRQPIWYGALYREEFERPWHLATIGIVTKMTLTPSDLNQWPKEIAWIMRAEAQTNAQPGVPVGPPPQVFLIPPQDTVRRN